MIDTQSIRSKILDLAMRGQLTEQLPDDGTAEELYQQIQKEKQKLIKAGKIKKEKPLPEITADEIPFEIPAEWKWTRLGDLMLVVSTGPFGSMLHESDYCEGGVPLVNPMHIQNGAIHPSAKMRVSESTLERLSQYRLSEGMIVVARRGDLGRCASVGETEDGWLCGTGCFFLNPSRHVFVPFITLVISSPFARSVFRGTAIGTTMANLNHNLLKELPFPLPPLAEQHRIVARIEQAFSALDSIDALQAQYADNLTVLKSKLIDAAIQGKMTEQLPEDGTADELYRQIQAEKQALINAGKVKKEKPLPEITAEEIPFEIPANWKWVRLGYFGSWHSGATPSRGNSSYYHNGTIPWLKTGDLNDDYISFVPEYITELALKECSVQINPIGSVLIAMYGATIGKLGIAQMPLTTNQACCACNPYNGIYNRFLFFLLMSMRKTFIGMGIGGAQSNISKEKIVNAVVPLPPLAEQKRIVARLEELLPLCERLK